MDFYDLKNDVESVFPRFAQSAIRYQRSEQPFLHPGQSADVHYQGKVIGWLGQLHPQIAKALDLPTTWVAQLNLQMVIDMHQQALTIMTPSKFPQVRRDIAVVVDKSIAMQSMKDTIKQVGGELLKDVWLFDVYAGSNLPENQQSLAFALVWQDLDATLSDERINAQMEAVIAALHEQYHATLRM